MLLATLIILLALILFGVGAVVKGVLWLLIIAAIILVVGIAVGWSQRSGTRY